MATRGSHGGVDVDRISSLPDHLLHSILLHMSDAEAAARTTVLSRRWRRVWADLLELSFCYNDRDVVGAQERAQRRVDAALAAFPRPTVTLLDIDLPLWVSAPLQYPKPKDPDRDDPLLRFLAWQ
jgi:hypothetical protein